MSSQSESSAHKKRNHSPSPDKTDKRDFRKLFITNLDGESNVNEVQDELKALFEKYGEVISVTVKRNRNSDYCFAFAEMKESSAAQDVVKNLDQYSVGGKKIKVEFQDDEKRRKDSNKGCYTCGKMGHFARECHSANNESSHRDRRRSRSRSEDEERRRKHKRRHRSDSSDRDRSRSPKKKQKKNRSKDKEEKKKKKHKKSYSSDS